MRYCLAGAEGISGLVVQPVELVIPAGPAAASRSRAAAAFGCGDKCRVAAELVREGCFAARGGALFFHFGETEKKCFIEEIPDETMVIGNYRTQLYDKQREEYQPATPGLGMFVEVKDPEDKPLHC
ncbi:transmembrane emp24 domain-containing protein 9-like [Lutra lutra]|uniref:transmembrane emp24 domain-containing protein 9-like n=1 Tax=Lutra lutra TaxID=9657 RepID=UPI001FD3C41B|nr:transmembrane emp24 domain-containing protein 9-like [Lutra lutra]